MMNTDKERIKSLNVAKMLETSYYDVELNKLKKNPIDKTYFQHWISGLMESISIMSISTIPFLEELILDVPWHTADFEEGKSFCNFIMSLVTSRSNITYEIIKILLHKLCTDNAKLFSADEKASIYPEIALQMHKPGCLRICYLISDIVKVVPLVKKKLGRLAREAMPSPHLPAVCQIMYLYNILILSSLIESHRKEFLSVVIRQIVAVDLLIDHGKLEDMLESDFVMVKGDTKSLNALNSHKTIDVMMFVMFKYIHSVMHGELNIDALFKVDETLFSIHSCPIGSITYTNKSNSYSSGCQCNKENQDESACEQLYSELCEIFTEIILPTYSPIHVQFLFFYVISIRPSLIYRFILLFQINFQSQNNSLELSRNAIAYVGSLMTRAKCISFKVMYACMQGLSDFCQSYIGRLGPHPDLDSPVHGRFYYGTQTLFYVFTFRYKEFTKDNLQYARALNLDSIVNSKLNPLRYCSPSVVVNFAAVTNHLELVYCYTITEKYSSFSLPKHKKEKQKIPLLDFQPFEPYLLPRSAPFVSKHYVEFSGFDEEIKIRPLDVGGKRKRTGSSSYSFLLDISC